MTDQEIADAERRARVIVALMNVAPPILADHFTFSPAASVAATRMGIEALAYFGIEAEAVPVEARIMNAYAMGVIEQIGHYLSKADKGYRQHLRAGYWLTVLGNYSPPAPAGQWNGHLVIGTDEVLIDLLLGMIEGPSKPDGIDLRASSFKRPNPGETLAGWDPPGGGRIIFEFHPEQVGYKDVPSWGRGRYRALTGRIIDQMKVHMLQQEEQA